MENVESGPPKSSLFIYYGTEFPNLQKTRLIEGGIVILQEYHPIIAMDLVKSFFPKCSVFLYWNPCKIWVEGSGSHLSSGLKLKDIEQAPLQKVAELNLQDERTLSFVLDEGVRKAKASGVAGLFIDDLDSLSFNPSDRELGFRVVESLRSRLERPRRILVNRAPYIWSKLDGLYGAVLEGISTRFLREASSKEFEWFVGNLLVYMEVQKSINSGIKFFSLTYKDGIKGSVTSPLISSLLTSDRNSFLDRYCNLIEAEVVCDLNLAQWPEELLC